MESTLTLVRLYTAATELSSDYYSHIALLLPASAVTASLLTTLLAALSAGGVLEVRGVTAPEQRATLAAQLTASGLASVRQEGEIASPSTALRALPNPGLTFYRCTDHLQQTSGPVCTSLVQACRRNHFECPASAHVASSQSIAVGIYCTSCWSLYTYHRRVHPAHGRRPRASDAYQARRLRREAHSKGVQRLQLRSARAPSRRG